MNTNPAVTRIWAGPEDTIRAEANVIAPGALKALDKIRETIPAYKREIGSWQAAALYALAKPYGTIVRTPRILEFGTALGYSSAVMAMACPGAEIVTMTPNEKEAEKARIYHQRMRTGVKVLVMRSVDWIEREQTSVSAGAAQPWDIIFVDGDHAKIKLDLPAYNFVTDGGLFLHHDYSPEWSDRPCQVVYDALNEFGKYLGHGPDIVVVNEHDTGMAGWYKQGNDPHVPFLPFV